MKTAEIIFGIFLTAERTLIFQAYLNYASSSEV